MDLNPVVHDHDSLNFEASKPLANMMAFFKGRLLSIMVSLWGIFLLWSVKLFIASGRTINLVYLLAEVILMAVAIFVSYDLFNRVMPVVVMIGRQVSITSEKISITTFSFNLRFWIKKPPQTLVFKINELRIRKTDNPLRFIRVSDNFDNRVFELRDKTKKAYVVFDYFDMMLKEKLTEVLVEVTPPELLIPGRLRHH
ncbi:MAG TPA: hypothetical protein VFE53_02560 [Mucilaginibacter sp.]|jgi:hypothetical protein|nr:hypothetical protein [Mucilaginibacter sp.]